MKSALKKNIRRTVIGVSAIALVAAVFIAGALTSAIKLRAAIQHYWTVRTEPRTPNAINVAEYIELGGVKQWITIRAKDKRNPVLLFLHGGPGGAVSDGAYDITFPLEDAFVVVHWDQRGAGRSAIDPDKLLPTMTYDRMVEDSAELLKHLKKRFQREKILVAGQSWGTTLGLGLVKRHPQDVAAFLAMGQVANQRQSIHTTLEENKKEAMARGDTEMLAELNRIGPMPALLPDKQGVMQKEYDDWIGKVQLPMANLGFGWYGRDVKDMGTFFIGVGAMSPSVSHSTLFDLVLGRNRPDGRPIGHLRAEIAEWDATAVSGDKIDVPYILMMGRFDQQTPISDAKAFYERLSAPHKKYIELPYAAHFVWFEQPGLVSYYFIKELIPFAKSAAATDWIPIQ